MEQARSFCSAAVVLTALCSLTPARPGPPPPPRPQAKAAQPRAGKEEDEKIRQLQHQLSWGRVRCTAGKHDARCRCRRGAGPVVPGADGVFDPDMRAPRPAPSRPSFLPRQLRPERRP